jgi:hypothetical protein
VLRLEYPISVKGSIVRRGVGVIRKLRSVVYTAITMTITVVIY